MNEIEIGWFIKMLLILGAKEELKKLLKEIEILEKEVENIKKAIRK